MSPLWPQQCPRVFTKLMKPVMALLRQQGIQSVIFLDDILLMAESRLELEQWTQETLALLRLLGFRINWEKSQLVPTQVIGIHNRCDQDETEEKVQQIITDCQSATNRGRVTVRELSKLIGRMSATMLAVLPAPLCYRELQQLKNRAFATSQSYDTTVTLSKEAIVELRWWTRMLRDWNGRQILPPTPDLIIETDASLLGWGAASAQGSTGGLWSEEERAYHINALELMGRAKTFAKGRQNIHIHLRMDNRTAMTYINGMGGTRSQTLSQEACDLWHWCLLKGITLSAEHLPGVQNTIADMESRTLHSPAEWMLERSICHRVMQTLGPCSIDLFATRLNNQLERYISWRPDPFAIATDAFRSSWQEETGYAFPPFALILQKVQQEQCTVVLITPTWNTQPWYPVLLDLLVEYPLLLPTQHRLLTDPFNRVHPLIVSNQLQLAAWKVSGKPTLQKALGFRAYFIFVE